MPIQRLDHRAVDRFIGFLANDEQCRAKYSKRYPSEFEYFERFYGRNGKTCHFARAAARSIFVHELKSYKDEFFDSLQSGRWEPQADS
jgi:hypothetical protein